MLRRILLSIALLLCLLLFSAMVLILSPMPDPPGPVYSHSHIVLDQVHIVDTRTGEIQRDRAIWINQGRIEQISAAGVSAPKDYLYVSGQGHYVVPGLWDNHSHSLKLSPQLHHPLYLAHGITYLRDMSGCMTGADSLLACVDDRRRWAQQAQRGERSSPLYPQQSSFAIDGGAEVPADFPTFLRLQSAEDATALVRHYQALGVDTLKTYELLNPQQYQWLSTAAASAGMQLAGHQPWRVTLAELIQARQHSVEHGRLFLFECSAVAMQLKQQPMREGLINSDVWRQILQSQDPVMCQQKMAAMARAGVWWSPTLLTLQLGASAADPAFRRDPRLAQVPWLLQKLWQADADGMQRRGRDQQGRPVHAELLALAQQQLKQAVALGVPILAGTDTPDSFVFAGSGLIDELELYTKAGLTPLQALQSATLWPAQYAGVAASAGTVDVGKDANLLLLADNPLQQIQALRQVEGLVLAGHWYDKPRLNALQIFSAEQAGSITLNLQLAWSALQSAQFRQQFAD
ncbi:amidohydrolase family protein [Rheinheimera sp. F8]|uniref:amidohydrolase family protein n=1 Tax=Rheinheimera sp. F8 TaxID=1763998 RepID=UPI000744C1D0|nr:amidohydrolase family protein [Rheinheimera sp. F8]ALZ75581.1 hypothetical protein ATY27_07295 [Rheinheimera sp. F8]